MASKLSVFLQELRRRKVYHVAVIYVVVGWGVITGAQFLFQEALNLPEEAWLLVAGLVILGLPIALVLAWAYEVRPEEARGDGQGAPGRIAEGRADGTKSIVVLPFDNMSPDPNDAYFSDGLTEEIITNLSYIHSLRVISRTSAMALKGTQKDIRTIAKELDVQYVLEGSVRKAGDQLRITAQLIDGRTDTHLWAEKYDGVLEDVFRMQEQASRSIVDALKVALDPEDEERLSSPSVKNLVAFEFYLKARNHIWELTDESLDKALSLLDQGLAVQPRNAELYASKAFVNCQVLNSMGKTPGVYPDLMREAQGWASKALTLDPNSSMAHYAQGTVHAFNGNPLSAITHWFRAVELNPNHADAHNYLGYFLLAGGCCPKKARQLLAQAERVDPLNPLNAELGPSYVPSFNGDFRAVLDHWKTWSTTESPLLRLYLGYFHAASGDVPGAVELFHQIVRDTPEHPAAAAGAFLSHALEGNVDAALESVTETLQQAAWWDDFTPILMADGYILVGEPEKALPWIDRAIEMGTTNVAFLGENEPFLRKLRGNPGFEALLTKAGERSEALAKQVQHR